MKKLIPAIVMIFIMLFGFKVNSQGSKHEVHFISTGQSDCILIKGEEKSYLIDTGFEDSFEKITSYLNSHGVKKLEQVIITHYHDDHYGSLQKLVQKGYVNKVVLPAHQPKFRDLVFSYLNNSGVEVDYITKGFVIKEEGINLEAFLSIKEDMEIENNNGTVLVGTIDNVKYAFMADVEAERENRLIKNKELADCDVMKIPHHAYDTSSTEALIKLINPKTAVVTCDGAESPNRDILYRYEKANIAIFRTDMNGDIVIKANPQNKEIEITSSKVIQ